ncbi:MAG TPA: RHS repeat-associated core domain-containing protein [Dokdonella sp.]|uniref:RHS repeat-associated core domain-containing protein n=3 Tax=Dokdonella sp. TaxID=2291710 RepID=UPI002C51C792|nr:RHS repeat-associated core domain-containing protein [Dokdonella sp.]HNV08732.1 RHS repeat-associated core domain-containing protein [Dokdonella sp.]HPW03218.1 RHS repeat-associated core domain-containing protein [Dokdonella sp.]
MTGSTTTWFGPGGYEESVVGGTRTQRHELGPVIVLRQNGSDSFKAVLRDRLGSQVMLVNGSPGQSTGLHASPNPSLDGRYTVRWNAMPGASRYELRESINNGLPSLIYNGAGLSWSPPSPKPIGTYRYTLRVCSPVCAADSAPVTEEVVPGAPTGLNLNPNPSSTGTFALSWSPVAGALLYQVEEKAETDADFHAVAMVSDPPGAAGPSWQASGKPTGDYQYRVRSCLTLCGNPSAIVTEVVTGGGGGQAPGAPFMNPPGAGSNTGQIALSWTPAAAPSPQPDYYAVQENGGYNIHVPSGTSLSLTRGNGTFTYKVRGCRNNPANPYAPFCGAYSNTVSVTVNASSIPAAPASISSTLVGCSEDRTNVEYAINWASSTGATSYELTETSDYDGDSDHTFTVFTTSQGFVHSTPPGETSITYSYTVKACNASGCSQDRGGAYACIGDDSNEPNGPDSTPIATAYDAFGKVRNGDYSDRPGGKLNLLPDTVRGFTGHQHVDDVRLIHMNGRVYDYQLGRFLSVDPIIQFPANSQSLNPYSYIMNNPLSGRDPSGYAVSSDDEIGHGVTMGVKTVYDFESVRQEAARASITGNGSEKQSTRVASASAAEATAPSSQKGVNNSTAPTAPMPITEDDYLKDPRGFWEGIPVSKGYSNDEQVRKAGDAVNSSHAKNTGDIQSTPEQRDFIKRIAKPTSVAQAEINYASKVKTEFYIQVAQNENGTFSIVGAARIPQGGRLERLPATTLVAHWHYAGLTQYPGRGDHSAPRNAGIPGFVITRDARSSRCCNMYEVGRQSGQYVYRSVAQDRPGSWKENSHWKDGE